MRSWVEACDKQHSCWQGGSARLPTRVLDVSQDEPYLFISNGQISSYITLSHCWSGEQPLVTETGTLHERIAKVPMDTLPALYQDAVKVTRELGIKYLWIDSLCIIQDCKDDWSREAARMADVYRSSYLTLYALSSSNCHQKMLVRRPQGTCNNSLDGSNIQKPLLPPREEVFKTAPLCQRAWAVQERLLSPRLLYYNDGELFWECLKHTAREGSWNLVPYKPHSYRYESYQCPSVKIPLVRPLGPNPHFPVSLPSDWPIIISEYTRCQLTYSSDKLPAISGLASIFQRNTGYTYIAGLWEEDLINNLLWFCPSTTTDHQPVTEGSGCEYRGPSWSWVSTDRPVQYKKLWKIKRRDGPIDIEFVACKVELAGPDPLGEIQSAVLTIRASFYRIHYDGEPGSRRCIIYDAEGKRIGRGMLDSIDENPRDRIQAAAACVAQRSTQVSHHNIVEHEICTAYLLILTPAPTVDGEERWRRLGLAWTTQRVSSADELKVAHII